MPVPLYQVDAFTDTPFRGNPAAVCLLSSMPEATWMQQVAREMNLSETAFLVPEEPESLNQEFALRWFTPTTEVDLCGHATLAAAHVLWEEEHVHEDAVIKFHTRSGLLTARRAGPWIELDFPAEPEAPASPPEALRAALPSTLLYVGRNRMDYLVLLGAETAVRTLAPDLHRLTHLDARGVIVTAAADDGSAYDFVSRFFAPGAGVPEDPVTGSAHCCLGPFWQRRLHKTDLVGYQASARGGVVGVRVRDGRVHLRGQAVTVLRGTLYVARDA